MPATTTDCKEGTTLGQHLHLALFVCLRPECEGKRGVSRRWQCGNRKGMHVRKTLWTGGFTRQGVPYFTHLCVRRTLSRMVARSKGLILRRLITCAQVTEGSEEDYRTKDFFTMFNLDEHSSPCSAGNAKQFGSSQFRWCQSSASS
eukprot:536445-Pelagomonas_calceolata.AAC.3